MRKLQYLFMTLLALCLATPAFAQSGSTGSNGLVALAAGLSMGIAAGLCGIGQGIAAGSATEAVARNPGAIAAIRVSLLLGLAFMESLALFTLVASKII